MLSKLTLTESLNNQHSEPISTTNEIRHTPNESLLSEPIGTTNNNNNIIPLGSTYFYDVIKLTNNHNIKFPHPYKEIIYYKGN